jgi:hypothetical protein
MRRPGRILVALLLGFSLGLQWTVLQSVAWASMLVERTAESGFSVAVRTTFDGSRPCSLCRLSREGRDAQQKSEGGVFLKKLDVLASDSKPVSIGLGVTEEPPAPPEFTAERRSEPPAHEPPRAA